MKVDVKTCTKCSKTFLIDNFSKDKSKKDELRPWCKDCDYLRYKSRPKDDSHKEIRRRATHKHTCKKYGLTPKDYANLLRKQNGTCAICKQKCHKTLSIDHCHTTNIVRGLLCMKCNVGLGYFNHDIKLLSKSVRYLRRKC